MRTPTPAHFPRQYIVDHLLGLIGCMDRRRVSPDDPHLGNDRLFQQVRGGRYGLASLAVAMEVYRRGSFTDLNINLATFAQNIGSTLAKKGIITTKHGPNCGGIKEALTIHNGLVHSGEDMRTYRTVRQFKPDITKDDLAEIADAALRIRTARKTSSPAVINAKLATPPAVLWTPDGADSTRTPHVDLDPTNHDEVWFVADYRPDVALDRAAAHKDGYGAYYSSLGAFEKVLANVPEYVANNVGGVENWWNTEAAHLGVVAASVITHVDENGVRHPYPIDAIA